MLQCGVRNAVYNLLHTLYTVYLLVSVIVAFVNVGVGDLIRADWVAEEAQVSESRKFR